MKMNRLFALSALVAGSVLLLGSCQEIDDNNVSVSHDGKIMITAEFPECIESKVAASDGTASLEISWEDDDYLTVVSGSVSEIFTMVSHDGKIAKFSGNPVEGSSYDVFLSKSTDYQTRSYNGQTQTTVASTDHLEYEAVLKGVTSYNAVSFTDSWAEANGGELLQNGCLLLYFQMPEDAGKLKSVTLTAPSAIFYTTNASDGEKTATLSLALSNADMVADNVVRAHIMTSMQEASIPADAQMTLTVVSNIGTWSKEFTPGVSVLKAGVRNVIKLNSTGWTVPSGDGSATNPYILRTAADMLAMDEKLSTSAKKYFAMVKDIDMSSVTEWIEIQNDRQIDFNGNDRTIDKFSCASGAYRGFIRILNGSVYNLTFTNANVDGTASEGTQPCGILAGYCGNAAATAYGVITDVHVEGTVNGAGSTAALVGVVGNGKIDKCSADAVVTTSGRRSGGLVGSFNDGNDACRCDISNCWTSGSFTTTNQNAGGIIGELHQGNKVVNVASVTNCYSTMAVQADRNVGGVVGFLTNSNKYSKVTGCIAWNSSISTTGSKTSFYGSGVVIGYTKNRHEVADNFRKSDIVYDVKYLDLDNQAAPVFDCRNFNDANPFVWTDLQNPWGQYYQPYHGIAAGASETVSDVARRVGWSEKVWDLSGPLPVLKR